VALVPISKSRAPVDSVQATKFPKSIAPVEISIFNVGSTKAVITISATEPDALLVHPKVPSQLIGESNVASPTTDHVLICVAAKAEVAVKAVIPAIAIAFFIFVLITICKN
jgi:hypothetical protein